MDHELIRDIILGVNVVIAFFLFFVHIKNRRTQLSIYYLTRSIHRSSINDFIFISSEQVHGNVLLKFVLFNPGSVAAVIQSFSVYDVPDSYSWLRRRFEVLKWRRIEDTQWWPTRNVDQKEPRYLEEEYENLYVGECRVIMARIPGVIDRRKYLFRIDTNHGYVTTECAIDAVKTQFACRHERRYKD
jgi:hypothetical protein